MNIGEVLKDAREEKGITVTDVSAATRISKKYIQALEDNNFLLIPSQVYAKGFMKAYCEYLGLDPKPLVEELVNYFKRVAEEKRTRKVPLRKTKANSEIKMPKIEFPKLELPKFSVPSIRMPKIRLNVTRRAAYLLIAGLIVIICALPVARFAVHSYRSIAARMKEPILIKANPPSTAKVEIKKIEVKKSSMVNVPAAKVQLKLEVLKRSWIQVTSGSMVLFNKTLDPGAKLNFFGGILTVKAGNGSGVKAYVNGEDTGTLGPDNTTAQRTFRASQ